VFGFSAEEALGQNLDLIIPERLREAHWRGFDQAMATGHLRLGGEPTVTRGVHKSGARLYVEMTFALVSDNQGKSIGSVAVARNVTVRVEREKAARSSAA
jgi:PAS domain S-box-containing protein